ncbi:MAG: lycopene cyclase domain-containing protein [Candidatus Kapaibacteriota bacterium]
MTYRRFHLLFNAPVMLALAILVVIQGTTAATMGLLAGLCLLVVTVTFPWDNWAVRRGVWEFGDGTVWCRVRALPIEEVAFFVIQTIEVALLTLLLMPLHQAPAPLDIEPSLPTLLTCAVLVLVVVGLYRPCLRLRQRRPDTTYAVHLLYWISPFLIIQWIIGWEVLISEWVALVGATVAVGTYLTMADVAAVRRGIWFFDHAQVQPTRLWGILPWEEMAFFYLTSLLVAQSMILLAPAGVR